jgi:hypothetical protein
MFSSPCKLLIENTQKMRLDLNSSSELVRSQRTLQRQLRCQIYKNIRCIFPRLNKSKEKYRALENKKIEMAMINTLQLAARKNLIQMSLQW